MTLSTNGQKKVTVKKPRPILDPLKELQRQTNWVKNMQDSLKLLVSNRRKIITQAKRDIKGAKRALKELNKVARVSGKLAKI